MGLRSVYGRDSVVGVMVRFYQSMFGMGHGPMWNDTKSAFVEHETLVPTSL